MLSLLNIPSFNLKLQKICSWTSELLTSPKQLIVHSYEVESAYKEILDFPPQYSMKDFRHLITQRLKVLDHLAIHSHARDLIPAFGQNFSQSISTCIFSSKLIRIWFISRFGLKYGHFLHRICSELRFLTLLFVDYYNKP